MAAPALGTIAMLTAPAVAMAETPAPTMRPVPPTGENSIALSDAVQPEVRLTGNASVVSDYLSRGVSLSDNGPAFQANVIAVHKSGIYASGWASSTHFANTRAEFDLSAGYSKSFKGTVVDLGYTRYMYPNAHDVGEIYISATRTIRGVVTKVGTFYTWDTPFGKRAAYPYIDVKMLIIHGLPLALGGHLGYFKYDQGRTAPYQNYADWNLTVSSRLKKYEISVAYAGTSVTEEPTHRLAGPKLVFSISRSF